MRELPAHGGPDHRRAYCARAGAFLDEGGVAAVCVHAAGSPYDPLTALATGILYNLSFSTSPGLCEDLVDAGAHAGGGRRPLTMGGKRSQPLAATRLT